MAISANYQRPVVVNGYSCWNCHQVSEAKKGVNPATQGPFGVQTPSAAGSIASSSAAANGTAASGPSPAATSGASYAAGAVLDISI
jgi:hypothetical protein